MDDHASLKRRIQTTVRLELGGTKFSGSIPTTLGNLSGLKYLDLEVADLMGTIPTELGRLVNLSESTHNALLYAVLSSF